MAQHRITQWEENLQKVLWCDDDRNKAKDGTTGETSAATESEASPNDHETNSIGVRQVHQDLSADSKRYMQQRRGSIWAKYRQCFELELNGKVDVVVPRAVSPELLIVRRAATTNVSCQTKTLVQLMEQPFFARCFEVFGSASSPYLVCEYLSLTLGHILGLPLLPTEVEVAAIAGQVRCGMRKCRKTNREQLLQALTFLEQHKLVHQRLAMSNVLLSDKGYVKIGW